MDFEARVLDPEPVPSLDAYVQRGGGKGIEAAVSMGGAAVIEELEASGLRGRGGAGFPTGKKWRTVAENRPEAEAITVVVNGAEGEPGSFKDRTLLRRNPYRVVEGALIAARTVAADRVVVAIKESFTRERVALEQAMAEVTKEGWADGLVLEVFGGPSEYLYGEETALLEVLSGGGPFPRITPPYRRGVDEEGEDGSGAAAQMAGSAATGSGEPVLVNNVETMANVPLILANGPDWFREVGTVESPGTVVCTVTGDVQRNGVAEFPMGTPLRQVIDTIGGGARSKRIVAALSGVSNPLVPEHLLDTLVTYEDMVAAGTGLGAAGWMVFDERTDLVAVAHGVSRFLSVESCGQCTPCKQDGLAITDLLGQVRAGAAREPVFAELQDRLGAVTVGARCFLANQHQLVVDSLLALFPEEVRASVDPAATDAGPVLIAPLRDIVDGEMVLDERQGDKQPDWTFDATYSGQSPVDRIDTRRDG